MDELRDKAKEGVFQIDIEELFRALYDIIRNADGSALADFFRSTLDFLNFIGVFLAPVLFFALTYVMVRIWQINKAEREAYAESVRRAQSEGGAKNARWQNILDAVSSESPAEWRQAVIDADVMLDELLIGRGYMGDSLGERLKNVSPSEMQALDGAWEAHKVRNEIAHAGSDFILTKRKAREAIDNYRRVFEEFDAL